MAELRLAYTSSGVESVALIDQEALDSLASWLCNDNAYHDRQRYGPGSRSSAKEFTHEVVVSGYCDCCKHHAGEILAHFNLVRKPSGE